MEVEITEGALKALAKLPKRQAAQIVEKIQGLAEGLHGDIKHLHESDYGYRLRSGKYCILFDLETNKVVIQKIGHRRTSMTSSVCQVRVLKKSKPQIERQLGKLKAELEDLRDYVELLEARFQNKSKRRYTIEEAKQKLQI